MTAPKSLETRRAEMAEARATVLGIYRPLLDAWKDGISSNELDAREAQAFEASRAPLRRFQRLRLIVARLEGFPDVATQQSSKKDRP